jgi:hypothetical protein
MGFQQHLAHLSPSWLVSKATSLSQHLAKPRFNTNHKSTTMWKTSWGLSHWETHDNPTTSKTTYDIKEAFLTQEMKLFPSLREENILPPPWRISHVECELYVKQPLTLHIPISLLPTAPQTTSLPLKLDNGRLSLSLEILDYATFAPIMQLKRGTFHVGISPI